MSVQPTDFTEEETNRHPASELEIHDMVLGSHAEDPYLKNTNYGLGNLSKKEQYLQIQRHRYSLFAEQLFGNVIRRRAVRENEEETKRKVARWHWEKDMDLEEKEEYDRDVEQFVEMEADKIWNELTERERQWAVARFTDAPADWMPPHRSMMEIQQETSRSWNGHLMDNFFGRVREIYDGASEEAKEQLQRLGGR